MHREACQIPVFLPFYVPPANETNAIIVIWRGCVNRYLKIIMHKVSAACVFFFMQLYICRVLSHFMGFYSFVFTGVESIMALQLFSFSC